MMTIPLCICIDSSPASCLLLSDLLYYVIVLTYGYSYKNIHKYLTTVNEVVQFKIESRALFLLLIRNIKKEKKIRIMTTVK
jgi:hypothetical protein